MYKKSQLITDDGRIFFPTKGTDGKLYDPNGSEVVFGGKSSGERSAGNIQDDVNKAYRDGTRKTDWNTLLTTGGGALLAYALASSLVDKPYGERKKDSMWMKVLRALIPVGAGVAGGVAGHYLGTKMAADNNSSSNSTAKASSKANGKPGTVNVSQDWLANLKEENDDWRMPYYIGGGAMGVGGLAELAFGGKRWYESAKNMPHTGIFGKETKDWRYLQELRDNIEKTKNDIAAYDVEHKNWEATKNDIEKLNREGQARRDEAQATKDRQYRHEMEEYNKTLKPNYDKELLEYERAVAAGKAKGLKRPVPPALPKRTFVEGFTPTEIPVEPTYAGPTVAGAEAAWRDAVRRRAQIHGLVGGGLFGAGILTTGMGIHNAQQVKDLGSGIRQIFIDNNRPEDYKRLKQMRPDLPLP